MKKYRVGEISYNKFNSKMTIIKYNRALDIVVQFENGYVIKTRYSDFKLGNVKNPYDKSVYNIGYLGEGIYKATINRKPIKIYEVWRSMLQRCYDNKYKEQYPTYIGCKVCEEWYNFQNFAKWYNENYYEIDKERMELDKDILYKDNKEYSPETCVFVSTKINSLFISCDKVKGKCPIGTTYRTSDDIYIAQCAIFDKNNNKSIMKYLGSYQTPEDAFYKGYKPFKESYIKQVANEYKDKIPSILYDAMYNWKVEITD